MMYNVFLWVEACFIGSFLSYLFRPYTKTLRWPWYWMLLFGGAFFAEFAYMDGVGFMHRTTTGMSVFVVIGCVYYFWLIWDGSDIANILAYAPFWWVVGTLYFYFGSTANNLLFQQLFLLHEPRFEGSVRYATMIMLNIILYSIWSYAFYCRYRERKSIAYYSTAH
ncbi:hypothetical protein SAMN05660226_03358 [Parapedobacter luteus]|uniref:Uncharacterized protein n=2 Tax=Parapedobacter luteus TaxID=623280 RepID=A0A1T5EK87_9SPHI|nr:hypothetical protein SAMN05660226_03358 [Parapedobacter luteus]